MGACFLLFMFATCWLSIGFGGHWLFDPLRVEAGLEKVNKRERFVADLAMFHRTNYTVCLVLITTSVTAIL